MVLTLGPSEPYLKTTSDFVSQMQLFGLLALPIVLLLGFAIGHLFGRPLVQTAVTLTRLSEGRSATLAVYVKSGTEIGDMARAFTTLEREVGNSFKLRQTIGGMPTGVMTLDRSNDWRVDYANPALMKLLETAFEDGLLVGRGGVDVLSGSGLDRENFENLPDNGRRCSLDLGSRSFTLTIAHILSTDSGRIGVMVAWEDVSEKKALAGHFENAVKGVVDAVKTASTKLRSHAVDVNKAAGATQAQSEAVARSSEESSVSVTAVANAAEELAASVNEIANQMGNSMAITQEAAQESGRMVDVVRELQEAAGRIGMVVQMIGGIANQTNLLALNATIEGARAGESGRGFAVVANEVKALASQTSEAAEEVAAQVDGIRTKTTEAVGAIDSINSIIAKFAEFSMIVAAAVDQQRNATGDIARNTQQTASGTNEVAQSITEVMSASRETEMAAQAMLAQADQL